jgi:predicted dehydrogenase
VLLEKPGARRPDELDEVGELAATTARVVRVGFNHRFHPAIAEAARLVRSGRCGPVMVIRARYGHGGRLGYEREWRADRARSGGGELLDQGVHLIDLVEYLAGPSSLAYASIGTHFWPMEVEDNAFVHLRTDGGADAWLHASWTEWKNLFSFEVACRTAKLEITGLGGSYGPETLVVHEMSEQLGPPLTRSTQWPPGDGSWHAELEDVERAITGATSLGTTLAECRAHLGKVRDAYAR